MTISRRALLGTAGAAALAGLTSGCRGLTERVSTTSGGSRNTLTFQTWGADAEAAAFQKLVSQFEDAHRGVTVDLQVVPYSEMFTGIDAGLQSGTAPDVFRVDYLTMGLYSSTDQLLDVTDALGSLDATLGDDLLPGLARAVQYDGRTYGVPQQTDTSAVLVRTDALAAAGLTALPDSLDAAWSWEEFGDVADQLADGLDDGRLPFAVNWQQAGAYRWLSWLFQADGRLYDEGLDGSAIDSDAGRKALEFTASFFERGWVPQGTSTKGATYPDTLFASGDLAMLFAGNFLLPTLQDTIGDRFEYVATYPPRDVRAAGDLGGNALVATRTARNPELAAEFLSFMAGRDQMAAFCAEAVLLPTRQSLIEQGLEFAVRPDLMPVFLDQATTLTEEDIAQVTTPTFAEINLALQNELEETFVGGRSIDDTLSALADAVAETTSLTS
ncbi:sugar ABC transporter substrate-binding protein [Nocardioides anomalus]|uniref:Sugar ABC transporter substrate-binding protein n=1 Tax=Nocardioides anomalus TaxID=2712223 RepID=A0A6G6W9R4_9ACTN|nr:sugar ABC transporter substrate-binding protein [Nocardioides anomalus]QIG41780.1 sugar ABC transporter substrate-binding protein [Nocardioides anomalus]